jgi:hypothetical protein
MRDMTWRLGFTLTALTILVILAPSAGCAFGNRLVEQIRGQTPQAQTARYLSAIAEEERGAALALWPLNDEDNAELLARRDSVTEALLAYGPRLEHRILDVEWWTTCCEPGVADDPANAGFAHVRVAISGEGKPEAVYLFDVLVLGGYWGDAAGNPVRHWTIVDVYSEGESPLVWVWR